MILTDSKRRIHESDRFMNVLTFGDLRKAIEGVPDDFEVISSAVAVGVIDEICVMVSGPGREEGDRFVNLLLTFGTEMECRPGVDRER